MKTRTIGLVLLAGLCLAACDSGPQKRKEARNPDEAPAVIRDVPTVFRQTVGAQCTLRGTEQILVSGFGLVVGLNGTGGGPLPVQIQATMERELALGGVGKGGPLASGPLAGKTPRQVLADPSVAVVLVDGVITPGAPMGSAFDVRVTTLPGSSVSSLEGGQLWTTEMRLGPASPFGATRPRKLAEAKGPLFINPFADKSGAEAAKGEDDGVTRTVGRIIGGGRVTDPLSMELVLDSASHARASSIVAAVNTRFPPGPGDEGVTARGRNDQSIVLRVPRAFRDKSGDFVKLLQYTPIETAFLNEYAKRYTEELRATPSQAEELSWALVALGKPAIPFVQPLYDSAELLPRLAALRAGAKLGDMRVVPYLKQVAMGGAGGEELPRSFRREAMVLLGDMGFNPAIDSALRDLINFDDLETRIAAYEALSERQDPSITRVRVEGRFLLDIVPCKDELVYITQQGEPRVVIFGDGVKMKPKAMATAWGERFMLINDGDPTAKATPKNDPLRPVRLYYRDERSGRVIKTSVPSSLAEIVTYLGRKPQFDDDSMGLGLSYTQVVGILYQLQKQDAVAAAFTTEENRLMSQLLSAEKDVALPVRPESDEKRDSNKGRVVVLKPSTTGAAGKARVDSKESLIVPINREEMERQKELEKEKDK